MASAAKQPFRLFNPRPFPLFATALIFGIFCVLLNVWIALALLGGAILLLFIALKTGRLRRGVVIALCVALVCGYALSRVSLYCRNEVGTTGETTVTCRVIEVKKTEDGFRVTADDLRTDGRLRCGKIAFDIDNAVAVGDRMTLEGTVSIRMISLDTVASALEYRKGAKYSIDLGAFSAESGAPPLRHTIREKVRAVFVSTQGERAGGFSYAMLFGDTEFMEGTDREAIREAGVAHVIAVSGLHVGVLAAALLFLLRKLRLKDGVCLAILLPIFGFYAYLAGFTPSVLRASIMFSLSLAASALGQRYDDLSSLSFAAILILLVRPLYLFDLSFLMSFLAILGIQALGTPLEDAFKRHKMPPRLASGLALSAATTIALIPVSALVFGRIALVGFLLNLVVVPVASVSLILNVAALLPTLLFARFGILLSLFGYLPLLIAEISGAGVGLGFTASYGFAVAETVVYYATVFFVSKYSLAKRSVKLVVAGVAFGVLIILLFAA